MNNPIYVVTLFGGFDRNNNQIMVSVGSTMYCESIQNIYTETFAHITSEEELIILAREIFKQKNSPLIGFECVIGRKFNNDDYVLLKRNGNYGLRLSHQILDFIKNQDKIIEQTKIDTHPRYTIQFYDDENFDAIQIWNLELIL